MLQDEQTLRRTVAKNIAAYRKSHKDTQLDLARKLNYSDKSVSKWERGEGLPDVYILAQIAQLYGVTVSNLIGEEEPPKKANPHFHIYVLLLSVALVFVLAAILFTASRLLPYRSRRGCFSCTLCRCRALCVSSLPPSGGAS